MIRRSHITALCLLLSACGKTVPPPTASTAPAPTASTTPSGSTSEAAHVTVAVPIQRALPNSRGAAFGSVAKTVAPVAFDDKQPVALFKVRATYPNAAPANRADAVIEDLARPYYEALLVARLPPGVKITESQDIQITSIVSDTGVTLSQHSLTPNWPGMVLLASAPDGYAMFALRIQDEIPTDTPGLRVDGILCPVSNGGALSVTDKLPVPLELHSQLKAGAVTLKITCMELNPATNSLSLEIDPQGPSEKIAKLEFLDDKDVLLAAYEPKFQKEAARWLISIRNWKEPIFCRATFAPERGRLNIPFKVPLPSARVIFPDQVSTPGKQPPLQVFEVTIAHSPDSIAHLFPDSQSPRITSSPAGINLRVHAVVDGANVVDLAAKPFKIESWQENDKPRQRKNAETAQLIRLPGRAPSNAGPRQEVGLNLNIAELPAPGTGILAIKGTLGVSAASSKTRTIEFADINFAQRNSFKVDNATVMYNGARVSTLQGGPDSKTTLSFIFPQSLKSSIVGGEISVDGKPVATQFGRLGDIVASSLIQLSAPGQLSTGTVKFFASEELEEKRLPFHILIGTGPR